MTISPLPPEGEGWEALPHSRFFSSHVGPFFIRHEMLEAGEKVRLGFRVQEHQCNMRMVCHGGMLATFMDLCLARGLMAEEGFFGSCPTINMNIDYLAAAPVSSWVESRIQVLRRTNQLGFVQALIVCGDEPVMRGNGTYKRPRPFKNQD